jgi:microcystin-dependent protein
MGYWSDWYSRNTGKESCLVNAEFVMRALDKIPTSMPPTAHNHDDRYYTETETINIIYPVGSIYLSVRSVNPENYLPGTTWVAWGQGRTILGMGTSDSDPNGDATYPTVEAKGGSRTHKLTTTEMPSHSHDITDSGHSHPFSAYQLNVGGENGASGSNCRTVTKSTSSSTTGISIKNTGSGSSHNNLMPYITCYMFKRTS